MFPREFFSIVKESSTRMLISKTCNTFKLMIYELHLAQFLITIIINTLDREVMITVTFDLLQNAVPER